MNKVIFFNAIIRWGGEIMGKILWFLITIILARYLGSKDFGFFSYCFAFGSFLAIFTDIGTNIYLIKRVVETKQISGILRDIINFKAVIFVFMFILSIIFAFLNTQQPYVFILIILFLLLSAMLDPAIYTFRAQKRMDYETLVVLSWRVLCFIFVILSTTFDFHLLGASIFLNIAAVISLFVVSFLVSKVYKTNYLEIRKIDFRNLRNILKESLPLGFLLLFGGIFFKLNILLLKELSDLQEVGLYSASFKLIEGSFFLSSIFMGSVFPFFCETSNDFYSRFRIFKSSFVILFLISLLIAVVSTIWSSQIINFVYGEQYITAVKSFKILVWCLIFIYLNELFMYYNTSINRQKISLINMFLTTLMFFVINFLIVPSNGSVGAAKVLLYSQVFLFILNIFTFKKT